MDATSTAIANTAKPTEPVPTEPAAPAAPAAPAEQTTAPPLDPHLAPRQEGAVPFELELLPGLPEALVHEHLARGAELNERAWRYIAYYLVEMDERRLHNSTGHSSTVFYATARLRMDRRRVAELLAVGRFLAACSAIDAEVRTGRISWSQALAMSRVVVPEHETAWLERALVLTCRELSHELRFAKHGAPPRKRGSTLGLPVVRYRLSTDLPATTHAQWDNAKQRLSAEFGRPVGDAEIADVLLHQFNQFEQTKRVEGREHVPASPYRLLVRPAGDIAADLIALAIEDELGPVAVGDPDAHDPIERTRGACIACDAERVHDTDDGEVVVDAKTPPALRRRVLDRDRHRCRCCGSRRRVQAHHIRCRAHGGPTIAANLIALCAWCHALVHAGLLVVCGKTAGDVRFRDAKGTLLAPRGQAVPIVTLVNLSRTERASQTSGPTVASQALPGCVLDQVPDTVDGRWWRQRAEALSIGRNGAIAYAGVDEQAIADTPPPDGEQPATRSRVPFREAFAGVVGQDRVLARLEKAIDGSARRGTCFPHVLLSGPPGTGKTRLAEGIGTALGARVLTTQGTLIQDVPAMVRLLAGLEAGDVLFLDEIHAVPRPVLETLYEAVAAQRLSLVLQAGVRTKHVRMNLPAFTLVAATTDPADLPSPLLGRFGLTESLGLYALEDLAMVIMVQAMTKCLAVEKEAALALGEAARGTPRESLRLLERTLDEPFVPAANGAPRRIDRATAEKALRDLGYDAEGLWEAERRYLAMLRKQKRPLSLARAARRLGIAAKTIECFIEPVLEAKGLIEVTRFGRVALDPQPKERIPRRREARREAAPALARGLRAFATPEGACMGS